MFRSRLWLAGLVGGLVLGVGTAASQALPSATPKPPPKKPYAKKIVADGEKIRIGVYSGALVDLPTVIAGHLGFFKNHGLVPDEIVVPNSNVAAAALAGGSLDFVGQGTAGTIAADATGANFRMIVAAEPASAYTLEVGRGVALPHLKQGYPAVMQDLKGVTIGATATLQAIAEALFIGAGMPADSAHYVQSGTTLTSIAAISNGQIQGLMAFEPMQTICQVNKVCTPGVDLRKGQGPAELRGINGAWQAYTTTQSFIDSNPTVVNAFIQAIQDAQVWIHNPRNLGQLVKLGARYLALGDISDPAVRQGVARAMLKEDLPLLGAGINRTALANYVNFLTKYKLISSTIPVSSLVYAKAPRR